MTLVIETPQLLWWHSLCVMHNNKKTSDRTDLARLLSACTKAIGKEGLEWEILDLRIDGGEHFAARFTLKLTVSPTLWKG